MGRRVSGEPTMAQMYPAEIEDFEKATAGEKRVHRFVKEAARPHSDFICWYEPTIGTYGEPDFVLFGKKLGLLVLEVKDWTLQQIKAYTPFEFTLRIADKTEKKSNPDRQAKGYVNALMEKLKAFPEFHSDLAGHQGGLKIPIGRMVVFPNMDRRDYCDRALQWLIPTERALFREDVALGGEILTDPSGKKFFDRVSGAFPFRFRGMSHREFEKLTLLMWPESRIALPLREGQGRDRFQQEVRALDEAQARLALRLKPGHHIIKGPPGTGKTLVLVHRCCHLHKIQGKKMRILFVCYNIALVSYLKRLLHEKGVGTGEEGIHVHHFFQLCALVLGERLHYENEEPEYYEIIVQEALSRLSQGKHGVEPFDAVFIDEAQDFSGGMLRAILLLLKEGGDLVIALDQFQDLYRRRSSWSSLGIQAAGRVHHLRNVYRTTREIHEFTQRFLGKETHGQQLALDLAFRGEAPLLRAFGKAEEVEDFVVADLAEALGGGEYKRSEAAVIYDDKVYRGDRFAYDNRALPMRLLRRLDEAGIPAAWVSQDVRSKEMFDVTTDRVSLISIHSSKGLDFDLVYLVGMDRIHVTEKTWPNVTMLIYVAMTRAKYRLVIPYVEETELIRKMQSGVLPMGTSC
jgi:UvrD-like helicase C-terminal domain/Nuclease-related domain/AAA domain